MKLNLGCYTRPKEGYVNVDILPWAGVDRIVDLNSLPWPFQDGECEEVIAEDVIEHLGKLTKIEIVRELARITKIGGKVHIRVPCSTHIGALQALQHAHSFYLDSFDSDFSQMCFKCEQRKVVFWWGKITLPFVFPIRLLIRILARFGFISLLIYDLIRNDSKDIC